MHKNNGCKPLMTSVLACFLLMLCTSAVWASPILTDMDMNSVPNKVIKFNQDEVQNNFYNEDGSLQSMRIVSLPDSKKGKLLLGKKPIVAGETIKKEAISHLKFVPNRGAIGSTSFRYTASDGKTAAKPASIVINIAQNETPSPAPEVSATPAVTETASPAPAETVSPTPADTNSPQPVETASPVPSESATPAPTSAPTVPPSPTPEPIYWDMSGHWAEFSAASLYNSDILVGEKIGFKRYFYPDKTLNRLDFTVLLLAAFGKAVVPTDYTAVFEDESTMPLWVKNIAKSAYEAKIVSGSVESDGKRYFNPYSPLTRIEAIALLDKTIDPTAQAINEPTNFADNYSIPAWSLIYVKNMLGYGLIKGYDDNTIRPFKQVTKAEAAEMIWQLKKYLEKKNSTQS